jgi:hypothetical protein
MRSDEDKKNLGIAASETVDLLRRHFKLAARESSDSISCSWCYGPYCNNISAGTNYYEDPDKSMRPVPNRIGLLL